tara:strand:- start:26 stop:604 length:579 start_codon:yes stop_codon:yes gene_type:complete
MTKLLGSKRIYTAVFISGTGTNLKNLIKFSLTKKSPISIKIVISNKYKAKGLNFAKKYKIKVKIFKFNYKDDKKILDFLKKKQIKLICLAGFMKILSKRFIQNFEGKILNIHPSLLPKFKGLNTHERVINSKENFSGCTVHLVNSKLDCGKIILQKKVKVFKKDTSKKLAKRILKQEHIIYPKAIIKLISNR